MVSIFSFSGSSAYHGLRELPNQAGLHPHFSEWVLLPGTPFAWLPCPTRLPRHPTHRLLRESQPSSLGTDEAYNQPREPRRDWIGAGNGRPSQLLFRHQAKVIKSPLLRQRTGAYRVLFESVKGRLAL